MDSSDGFINDTLILSRGNLGFDVFADSLPIHEETAKIAIDLDRTPLDLALWGGEDYQLLMAIDPQDLHLFPGWHTVGQFTDRKDFYLVQGGDRTLLNSFKGWKHF